MTIAAPLHPNWIDRLDPAPRAALTAAMVRRRYARGALIYSRTEAPEGLYVVRAGSALFCLDGANGKRLLLNIIRANELFGETVALDGRAAPVSVEARQALEVDLIPRHRLAGLSRDHPAIEAALARVSAQNMRYTLLVLEEQALLGLRERVLSRLRLLAEMGQARGHFRLELTQNELAAMLGASRPAVNAVLAGLAARGLVARQFGALEYDPGQL